MPPTRLLAAFILMFFVTVLAVTGYAEYMLKLELKLFGPDERLGVFGIPYTPFWWDTLWICIAAAVVVYWMSVAYQLKKAINHGD